jgi:PAS domain S-box-containing protein
MRQRILQSRGRRYSLRLEGSYWDALTSIAARRGVRLNRLVAEIAGRANGGTSLASCLRAFCLAESQRAALLFDTAAERTSVVTLVETAPAPAIAVDGGGRIVAANAPLYAWIGLSSETLIGAMVLRHFRFHCRAGLNVEAVWKGIEGLQVAAESARIVHIAPGRVHAANARLIPIRTARGRSLCVIWITK